MWFLRKIRKNCVSLVLKILYPFHSDDPYLCLRASLELKRGDGGFFLVKIIQIWQGYNLWKLFIILA